MSLFPSAIAFWNARTTRERVMLQGLAVVLAGLLLWFGVLAPLNAATAWSGARRQDAAADLASVEAAARRGGGRAAPAVSGGLAGTIDVTAAAAGIVIERRRVEADGRLTVWIAAVSPRILMQWIGGLHAAHGVSVVDLNAGKADSGALEVEVSFQGSDR